MGSSRYLIRLLTIRHGLCFKLLFVVQSPWLLYHYCMYPRGLPGGEVAKGGGGRRQRQDPRPEASSETRRDDSRRDEGNRNRLEEERET